LTLRSYFVGYKPSVADIAIWGALKANAIFARQIKTGKDLGVYLGRWFNHMSAQAFVEASIVEVNKANDSTKVVSCGLPFVLSWIYWVDMLFLESGLLIYTHNFAP